MTIPVYVWKKAEDYFKKHRKDLRKQGIKSVSKLVSVWIEQSVQE